MSRSFLVFGAELPWVQPLAAELATYGPAIGVSLGASYAPWRRKVAWPFDDPEKRLSYETWTYPPGFSGVLRSLFAHPIRARVNAAIHRLEKRTGAAPFVITPYPYLLPYLEDVESRRLIYLNYDDYSVDRGDMVRSELPEEGTLINRAGTILCSSQYQAVRFRQRFPARSRNIIHLAHGVHETFINPEPSRPPDANTVCAVGYLSSRYHWPTIYEVASSLPDVRFSFIGEIVTAGQGKDWLEGLSRTLKLPNVVHIRGIRHRDTARYYWRSAASWMPYDPELRFVKSCSPLKLADGLAGGRAIVSADVPECRLYPEWISIYADADAAVGLLRAALASSHSAERMARTQAQIAFAERNTWASRANGLVEVLDEHSRQVGARAESFTG